MFDWLKALYLDFQAWLTGLWTDFVEFLEYLGIEVLDGILGAMASIVESIPVPSFIQNNGLQTAMSSISPDILYFVDRAGMVQALGILSLGFSFRLLRKLVTTVSVVMT